MTARSLSKHSILVVGGSSGIGLATAMGARRAGAVVTIASRSAVRLNGAAKLIGDCTVLQMDVRDEAAVAKALGAADPFNHVVVTAGAVPPGPVRGGSVEKAMAGFASKFWGAYHVAAYARIEEHGSLTLVSGAYAIRPEAGAVAASCVNAAVDALARGLALELAPTRVNAICPGLVDTPLWAGMDPARRSALFSGTAARLPAGSIGRADDVADLVLTCMTNPMLTGSVIVADGGGVLV